MALFAIGFNEDHFPIVVGEIVRKVTDGVYIENYYNKKTSIFVYNFFVKTFTSLKEALEDMMKMEIDGLTPGYDRLMNSKGGKIE